MTETSKPAFLGEQFAEQFQDASVVGAYGLRPPYPPALFDKLVELAGPAPAAVLDVGCGTGDLTRPLAPRVARITAVDPSQAMLDQAVELGGPADNVSWVHGKIEDVRLEPPYGLVVAGESLHWTKWETTLPMLGACLGDRGVLAIVDRGLDPPAWNAELIDLIVASSTNRDFRPYTLTDELAKRGLFEPIDTWRSQSLTWQQSADDYVTSFHSRNGFSVERIGRDAANRFDSELHAILARHEVNDVVLGTFAKIVWGHPAGRSA